MSSMTALRDRAARLDADDPLAALRERFVLPDGVVYLDGNSLGALSHGVAERVQDVVTRQWGQHLVRAWNDDSWWTAPERVGDRVARLLGAAPGQVVVGDSTSVQFFQALTGAARLRPGRRVVLSDPGHFPTNRYLASSAATLLGLEVREVPPGELEGALGDDVAAISYGVVDFRTGELLDVAGLTAAAHAAGALTVWDVCHAVGALDLRLDADGVDLAVGCTYKYLGGGPGAPAFLYVARRHLQALDLPLTGWHGHADPFAMPGSFTAAPGITKGRIGTPPMLSLLALEAALEVWDDVSPADVRAKSMALGDFFLACLPDDEELGVVSPADARRRGSQVTLSHPQAHAVMAALIARGVIGDLRPPDRLRFGWNALYVRYADVLAAARALTEVLCTGDYRRPEHQVRNTVT
jgi:kynureninase